MSKRTAVIVVTYNASEYIGACLSSLQSDLGKDTEVLVVDNASTDDTVERVRKFFPSTKLLPQSDNLGFAEGNNIGLRYAQKKNFDFAYLLNQDTEVKPGFLAQAVRVIESDPQIAAVGSKLLLDSDKTKINSLGNVIHYLGLAYAGGHNTPDRPLEVQDITYPSGAAVLLRLETLEQVGMFNPEFFMYHEDVDLGWRLWLAGYRCVLAPESVVYHKYEFSRSIQKFFYMERNRHLVLLQNYKIPTLVLLAPALLALAGAILLASFFGNWTTELVKMYSYFLNMETWRKIGESRRHVQSLRRVSDRVITRRFVGRIAFQDVQSPLVRYVANPVLGLYWTLVRRLIWW